MNIQVQLQFSIKVKDGIVCFSVLNVAGAKCKVMFLTPIYYFKRVQIKVVCCFNTSATMAAVHSDIQIWETVKERNNLTFI